MLKSSALVAHRQRGVALLIVLWMSLLLTVVAGGFAYNTQVEGLLTRRSIDYVKGVEAIKAGVEMAVYQLRHPDKKQRPWADGRPYSITFEKVKLTIRIQDESGKVALNRATQQQLQVIFTSTGLLEEDALLLADAVLDYIDVDDLVRLNGAESADYRAAGLLYAPKNAPFVTLEELLQVYGMDYSLYQKVVPGLTPYGNHSRPDLRLAPKAVLRTVPDMTSEFIEEFMQLRFEQTSNDEALPAWPDGRQLQVFAGSGPIYTIEIEAAMPNKTAITINAVVNLKKSNGPLSYTLLEWRHMDY